MLVLTLQLVQDDLQCTLMILAPYPYICGGARGVMVIVVGNGHGEASSNPGRD